MQKFRLKHSKLFFCFAKVEEETQKPTVFLASGIFSHERIGTTALSKLSSTDCDFAPDRCDSRGGVNILMTIKNIDRRRGLKKMIKIERKSTKVSFRTDSSISSRHRHACSTNSFYIYQSKYVEIRHTSVSHRNSGRFTSNRRADRHDTKWIGNRSNRFYLSKKFEDFHLFSRKFSSSFCF